MDKVKQHELEYRMYGFVPYSLIGIQKGIQYGHAVVEYANAFIDEPDYVKWSTRDKTFIILNGGTTNRSQIGPPPGIGPKGSLDQIAEQLYDKGIQTARFYEPDLNDALTAVVFLVDERVFDREAYPDFISRSEIKHLRRNGLWTEAHDAMLNGEATRASEFTKRFAEWVEQFRCGDLRESENFDKLNEILYLRNLLPKYKLA